MIELGVDSDVGLASQYAASELAELLVKRVRWAQAYSSASSHLVMTIPDSV